MKTTIEKLILLAFGLQLSADRVLAAADTFNSGSTGAYGAMYITNDTFLDMPPDGIFYCTTITVNATLRFNRNPLNTPVYLLATGDVIVNGTIDVSASGQAGGPCGFDGGNPPSVFIGLGSPGDGQGPGGGRLDARGPAYGSAAFVYGNALCSPLVGGSGAAGWYDRPGGGGGGAILIASNTKITIAGAVTSFGFELANAWNNVHWPAGSGGAIRLVAPLVGGNGSVSTVNNSPSGRTRIDCIDDTAYRTLGIGGSASRGWQMFVFPPVNLRLDIIEAAGKAIAEGTGSMVQILLPKGASTNQTVTVQARNFTADVPIRVVVTPDHGLSASYDATIPQSSGNPPKQTVNVVVPSGTTCRIHAWTR